MAEQQFREPVLHDPEVCGIFPGSHHDCDNCRAAHARQEAAIEDANQQALWENQRRATRSQVQEAIRLLQLHGDLVRPALQELLGDDSATAAQEVEHAE